MNKSKIFIVFFLMTLITHLNAALDFPQKNFVVIHRKAWDFDRSSLEWYKWGNADKAKKEGRLNNVAGWAEYDFKVPESGWYELWQIGVPPEWTRDIYLDGKMIARLHTTSSKFDRIIKGKRRDWSKEFNLYLKSGKHSLRYRRLAFPACLPREWELIKAGLNPLGSIRVKIIGHNILRAGEKTKLEVTGGMANGPSKYKLLLLNENTKTTTTIGEVSFPASETPVKKIVAVEFPSQGVFRILAQSAGKLSRPADLNAGMVVAIDTKNPPTPSKELKRTLVIDIDCTVDRKKGFWEKDGKTNIIKAPFGKYRESSGNASDKQWGLDGFSYSFDLPDANHLYQLVVEYPDDDRRTMGFWINDGIKDFKNGVTLCGGVETGDRYRLSHQLQTHTAFFYPRQNKGLIIAVLNLARGCKAAASRIKIYRIDGNLPAASIEAKGGRMMGYYFEESGRWIRHFGGGKRTLEETLKTMERWGQWNRYMGANLMFPTINVYQDNRYPSNILEGYFNAPYDECRVNALIAEKYGCKYVPEFHLSGQTWFEKHVMGVWTVKKKQKVNGREKTVTIVKFRSTRARERVLVKMDGTYHCSWKPFVYNALHPDVQKMYISVLGELADKLRDCKSFAGISSRLMLSWQWMGWNALPGLKWGYGDWTIARFEKDTGIKVPGKAGSPDRFHKRFEFLTGQKLEEWQKWRCDKMLDYYRRLRDRIRNAKASAKLVLTWHGADERAVLSKNLLKQMKECGIRWKDFTNEPGILIVPGIIYGRRFSTPVSDADKQDRLYEEDFKTLCKLGDRGVMLYSDYFEVNKHLKWEELGGSKYCAFDCCAPGGVNELELYAIAMADSDCSFIANGGNGWFFGTPKILTPFLKEYRALPARQFKKSEKFSDPVAIWSLQGKNEFWFYAVNRLPFPVKVSVELNDAGNIISASTGQEISKSFLGFGRTISFELPAFMMKSFKTTGRQVAVKNVEVNLPDSEIEKLKPMMRFARKLLDDLKHRRVAIELSEPEADKAVKLLAEALKAFEGKRYWLAKGNLSRANMIRIYDMIGHYPPGLDERKVPRDFVDSAKAPKLVFNEKQDVIGDVRGRLSSITDICFDKQGDLFAASPEQLMEFSARGKYLRSYRLVLPHQPDKGGIRWGGLLPPRYQPADSMRILNGNKLAALYYNLPLYIYNLKDSLLLPQINGNGFQMPGTRHRQLAMDSKGNIYIGCYSPKGKVGVWKFNQDGNPVYDFTTPDGQKSYRLCDIASKGLAIDNADKIYVGSNDKIYIYSENGKLLDSINSIKLNNGVGALASSPDGKYLFAASGKYGELIQFALNNKAKFEQLFKEKSVGAGITSLQLDKEGKNLIIGYDKPVNGAVAVKRSITQLGLGNPVTLVKGLGSAPDCLNGFTQIKEFKGNLYYLNGNKMMVLKPGENDPKLVHDFKSVRPKIQSFAFTPQGDLYLSSNFGFFRNTRGTNVYLAKKTATGWAKPDMLNNGKPLFHNPYFEPTDMAVDKNGSLYIRHHGANDKNEHTMRIYRRSPKTGKMTLFCSLGSFSYRAPKSYGLHIDKTTGNVYVASAPNRTVACYSPKGKLIWKTGFKLAQGPGSVPIRNVIGITTDSHENVWVTDPSANRILCFDKNGKFLRSYGHFGTIDKRDGESFCYPVGIATAVDDKGREWLYVADVNNQRIKKFKITY